MEDNLPPQTPPNFPPPPDRPEPEATGPPVPAGTAPAARATFPPKRITVQLPGDRKEHHTATIERFQNASDVLRAVGLDDEHFELLDEHGQPLPFHIGVYGLFDDGQVVKAAHHPDHPPRKGPLPTGPVLSGR